MSMTTSKTWPVASAPYAARQPFFPAAARGALIEAFRGWLRWRAERRTVDQLSQLEGHILEDIGLERSEIPVVARRLAQQAW